MNVIAMHRAMTTEEENLLRWLLSNGIESAKTYLPQVDLVRVSPRRCRCGCASFDLVIPGRPPAKGGMGILSDFVFGEGGELSGIFVFERDGDLAGVEVCGYSGDAPKSLPSVDALRPH
ncbi:hypothetical protein [Rhodanobacter sp. DHG33]|uniref:hypothetical protein n=1 Tax=Rhodanobacter sp. DHG33 TaxID=2775921 RepID=UPI00177EC109|nr:hypothetical protein [Rhodanobacter sp. DHG33]MBD8900587.1 hypothetical protein [Rhodanobacter sp. DHG33]